MTGKTATVGHGDRALCGAKKKQGEGTCTQVAGWGTSSSTGPCKLHGGSTRNHKKAAEVAIAKQAVERYGLAVDIDPAVAMMRLVAKSYGSVLYLEARVAELDAPWLEDKPHVAWQMLMVERKHHAEVCRDALRAGVERRAIELAEDMARQIVAVLTEFARRLGLDPAAPEVREAGRVALALLPGGTGG